MPGTERKPLLACLPGLGFADTPSLRRGPRSCQIRNPRRPGHWVPVPDARIWVFKMRHPVRARRDGGGRSARHRQAVRAAAGPGKPCASPVGIAPSRPSRARERCTKPRRPRQPAVTAGPPRGLRGRTPATQGERRLKQQPPHRSGRTRKSWRCLGFRQLQTPATETTLFAERSAQTPRPGSRHRRPGRGAGEGGAKLRAPPPYPPPIGPRSRLSVARKAGLPAGAPNAGRFPWQRGAGCHAQCQRGPRGRGLETLLPGFKGYSASGVTTALSPTFPNLRSDYSPSL